MAIKQEQTSTALEIITRIVGDLKQPDTGILFRIPIDAVWGMEQL